MGLLPFGAAITLAAQTIVFKGDEDIKDQLKTIITFQNMVISFVFIVFQLVIREKPDIPPSAVAEADEDDRDLCQSFAAMGQNSSFMLLTLGVALTFGTYVGFGNCVSNILDPFGLEPDVIA